MFFVVIGILAGVLASICLIIGAMLTNNELPEGARFFNWIGLMLGALALFILLLWWHQQGYSVKELLIH